jgi:hypothetical protein
MMKVKLLASALFFFLFGTLLSGQDATFKALAPATVKVGDQFQYVIEGSERGSITLPPLNYFDLLAGPFSSYSSHSQWVNGKMTKETVATYTYVFRAKKEGTLSIRPSTIKVGRKAYQTNEVKIVVSAGPAPDPNQGAGAPNGNQPASPQTTQPVDASGNDPVFLRVTPTKREVYVGEQFVSGLKVYTRVNTRPASSSKDIPYEGFFKKSLDPDATAQRQTIGGQQYVTQVIQRHILIPQKTGEVVIPAYESEWMLQQRVQRKSSNSPFDSFFDDPFFSGVQDVPTKLSTRPVTIKVKPLPTGAPEGFSGGVGDFSMNATLSADEIEVNEALSLKITVKGTGNLPLMGEPTVNLPPDHDVYDETRSLNTSTSGKLISGTVTFEYPIVARHAGRFRIAPVQFAWFDPKTESYHTATSQEFTFTVLKGDSDDAPAAVYTPGVLQENVADLGTDIRDISRTSDPFTPLSSSLLATHWYRWAYSLIFLLGIIILILFRLVARRNADLTLVRNRQANKMARARLKKADRLRKSEDHGKFYEEVGKAIWGYLSDKLNIETSKLSREGVMEQLQQQDISDSLRKELLRILDDSEFSRFAPSSEKSDVNQLYSDAASLIRNLENSLK